MEENREQRHEHESTETETTVTPTPPTPAEGVEVPAQPVERDDEAEKNDADRFRS